jgi:demethylmenaquinone methyltransferase/2-methoxy-6-polyprenyl-1,4-benzoquinol methylase
VEIGPGGARYYDFSLDLLSLGQYSHFIKSVVEKMSIKPGQSILDLGSGTGRNDCFMAEKVGPQGRIVGLDSSDEMLSRARKRCGRYSNITFKKQRIELFLPYYKEEFDKVFISFVLHGFEDDQKLGIIHGALQALKPGGVFYILDYSEFDLDKTWLPLRFAFTHWECQLAVEFLRLDIKEMLQSKGFTASEEEFFFKGYLRLLKTVKPLVSTTEKRDHMNRLEKALSELLGQGELTTLLAQVLAHASERDRVTYREVEEMINGDAEDVLLLGNEWRLLLPVRTLKSAAWEDRLLLAEPAELYELPNIVKYLVEDARKTGRWEAGYALAVLFRDMGEPNWGQIPKLVARLKKQARDYRITAAQIKTVCNELGLGDRVDPLVAELKGGGVMSPKLGSLAEVSRAGTPIYELNPSLFTEKGEKNDWTSAKAHGRDSRYAGRKVEVSTL